MVLFILFFSACSCSRGGVDDESRFSVKIRNSQEEDGRLRSRLPLLDVLVGKEGKRRISGMSRQTHTRETLSKEMRARERMSVDSAGESNSRKKVDLKGEFNCTQGVKMTS